MANFFLALCIVFVVVDWLALLRRWTRVNFITKPGALLALFSLFWVLSGLEGRCLIFSMGLLLSLIGDILLLFPKRAFSAGAVAFFLAHLAYILSLRPHFPAGIPAWMLTSGFLFLTTTILIILFRLLANKPHGRQNSIVIFIYYLALGGMFLSALLTLTRAEWLPAASWLAACGGGLFYLSDTLLSFRHFNKPWPHAQFQVRVTYHLGQILLTSGFLLQAGYLAPMLIGW